MSVSIRQRLTLWYTAAVVVLLAIVAISLSAIHARLSLARLDAELERLNGTVATVLTSERSENAEPKGAAEEALTEARTIGRHLAILDRNGDVLAARWTLPAPPRPAPPGSIDGLWTLTVRDPRSGVASHWRVVSRADPPVPDGFIIVAAASWAELDEERADMMRALIVVIPIALVIAAGGAWWVAGRALRPAAAMAAEAHRITEHSSGARLTIVRDDELGRLAASFNGLVDRLERALDVRRRFLAEASHDLRTPISIARTAADVALSRAHRSEAEYRESLEIVSQQMTRLGRMVADMLTLARTDVADWPLVAHEFYLDELIDEVVRAMRLLADERRVRIESACPADLQFKGDEGLLRQMLLNLIENAVRHSRADGTVTLRVTSGARGDATGDATAPAPRDVTIDIHNTGAMIADADRDRIFERFVRLDAEADRTGLGLGLPIARRIARAHGGDLTLVDTTADGTTFRVTLARTPLDTTAAHAAPRRATA